MTQRITTRQQLKDLAQQLGVRNDWHEPDNHDVDVILHGTSFDNAGFWGDEARDDYIAGKIAKTSIERSIVIVKEGERVGEVNLATLFAWATGYADD